MKQYFHKLLACTLALCMVLCACPFSLPARAAGATVYDFNGTNSIYVSAGVDFALPVDTTAVTSIKVRMYVPTYSTSGTPQLRILSSNESTSIAGWIGGAFVDTWGGAFDQWVDIDITDAVNSTVL